MTDLILVCRKVEWGPVGWNAWVPERGRRRKHRMRARRERWTAELAPVAKLIAGKCRNGWRGR